MVDTIQKAESKVLFSRVCAWSWGMDAACFLDIADAARNVPL